MVSLTRTGFTGNPIGFRAVKIIAEAAAALPLVLQDQERRYETHPIQELLARPNAAQGRAEVLEALYGQLLLTGNGYLEGVGDEGLPLELHVLRSDRMRCVPGADGWPVAYEYGSTGASIALLWPRTTARCVISRASIRKMTTTGFRRCRPRPVRLTCIMRRRVGPRRCWTTRPVRVARLFTKVRMASRR